MVMVKHHVTINYAEVLNNIVDSPETLLALAVVIYPQTIHYWSVCQPYRFTKVCLILFLLYLVSKMLFTCIWYQIWYMGNKLQKIKTYITPTSDKTLSVFFFCILYDICSMCRFALRLHATWYSTVPILFCVKAWSKFLILEYL